MSARPAFAQATQPHAGSLAIAGEGGFFVPDKELDIGPVIAGSAEFYPLARFSVRGLMGWTNNDFKSRSDDSLQQLNVLADVLYNWEGGAWHPYVAGGFGLHFRKAKVAGRAVDDWRRAGGLNGGAGIEYFSMHDVTVKVELLYQYVAHETFEVNPSGLALKIGLKKYLW